MAVVKPNDQTALILARLAIIEAKLDALASAPALNFASIAAAQAETLRLLGDVQCAAINAAG